MPGNFLNGLLSRAPLSFLLFFAVVSSFVMSQPSNTSRDRVHVDDDPMELSSIRAALPDSDPPPGAGTPSLGSGAAQRGALHSALSARSALGALVTGSRPVGSVPPSSADEDATLHGLGPALASSGRPGESGLSFDPPAELDGGGRLQRVWT